ncbi:transcriptional Coactivator p15-domain-containing protein [Pilobolus umbonatus]|nr:transcriptional Coactivator p15-domain-containing protein [Pilobolus umbonatus]
MDKVTVDEVSIKAEEKSETPQKKQKVEEVSKKRKRADDAADKQESHVFELSAKRRITVRAFSSGVPSVDIREVYKDQKTNEMRPGKAGICMPLPQWKKLIELLPEINKAIEDVQQK